MTVSGFDALGFLSTDVEEERRVLREIHATAFANVEPWLPKRSPTSRHLAGKLSILI